MQFHVHNRQPLLARQPFEKSRQIVSRVSRVKIRGGEDIVPIVQRFMQLLAQRAPAQHVDELVFGNCMYPRRQRLFGVVGMTLVMQRQQGFLEQVFHFIRQAR